MGGGITIVSGASFKNGTNEPVLNSTEGGQVLEFGVYLGNATQITVTYGPVDEPNRFTCSDVFIAVASEGSVTDFLLRCTTAPGYGADLAFLVRACVPATAYCFDLHTAPHLFHYPPPVIYNGTLREFGKEPAATGNLFIGTTEPTLIEIRGYQFRAFSFRGLCLLWQYCTATGLRVRHSARFDCFAHPL